ncbi:MAG: SDR family NAD(P)-dependent oxidoreductase [Leptospiraceae bacterium]|nr:SDR family NAD(P)-dependent oxidoreductase [Leptospiraceae bacterium]
MITRTAFVTGASSGFGAAIARRLAERGMKLILLARRSERLQKLASELGVPAHTIACDIRDNAAVKSALQNLPAKFRDIDILVNNAGLALGLESADKTDWADWLQMIDTNCTALAYLTRLVVVGMVERRRGHIINMGSVAGHYAYPGGNVYGASKAFVEQFSRGLRADLAGHKIRVTHIAPGLAGGSEFSQVRFHGDEQKAQAVYENTQPLMPADIAECVDWVIHLPEHVNINSIELMPTCQAAGPLAVHRNKTA